VVFRLPSSCGTEGKSFENHVKDALDRVSQQISNETGLAFFFGGALTADYPNDRISFMVPCKMELLEVVCSVDASPEGDDLVLDVLKNGTTIFTNNANVPYIADGATSGISGKPDINVADRGDTITMAVIQIGNTSPGTNLAATLTIRCL
jgi:hypothetical protein